ncbi:MAG: MbtH family NRPS accessory protein [Pseudonocardiaceae bacterium]
MNPFDNESKTSCAVLNDGRQYSLWPTFT